MVELLVSGTFTVQVIFITSQTSITQAGLIVIVVTLFASATV
jgi:hypothetical protein